MEDKLFTAILAKNEIARQMKNNDTYGISVDIIMECLNQIEEALGTTNQPSVEDTFNSKYQ